MNMLIQKNEESNKTKLGIISFGIATLEIALIFLFVIVSSFFGYLKIGNPYFGYLTNSLYLLILLPYAGFIIGIINIRKNGMLGILSLIGFVVNTFFSLFMSFVLIWSIINSF